MQSSLDPKGEIRLTFINRRDHDATYVISRQWLWDHSVVRESFQKLDKITELFHRGALPQVKASVYDCPTTAATTLICVFPSILERQAGSGPFKPRTTDEWSREHRTLFQFTKRGSLPSESVGKSFSVSLFLRLQGRSFVEGASDFSSNLP